MVLKRDDWVKYLESRAIKTRQRFDSQSVENLKLRIQKKLQENTMKTLGDLELSIIKMLKEPNGNWAQRRNQYLTKNS